MPFDTIISVSYKDFIYQFSESLFNNISLALFSLQNTFFIYLCQLFETCLQAVRVVLSSGMKILSKASWMPLLTRDVTISGASVVGLFFFTIPCKAIPSLLDFTGAEAGRPLFVL